MGYKKFLVLYFSVMSIFAFAIWGILLLLGRVYEHNSYDEIVDRQVKYGSIYGSILNNNAFLYSLALIKKQKPAIVVLGTSRVAQLRSDFFNTSFVTTPNSSNSIGEMELFVEEMLKLYKPKIVMLGVDPWILTDGIKNYKYASYQKNDGDGFNLKKILEGGRLLFANSGRIMAIIKDKNKKIDNPFTPYDSLGFYSIEMSNGAFVDGSRYYFSTFYGKTPSRDFQFKDTFSQVHNGVGHLVWSDSLNKTRLEELEHIVQMLQQKKIKVVVFFAPIAPTVYKEIEQNYREKYGYFKEIGIYAKKSYVYDVIDARKILSTDCEFYDGLHGGDTAMAKMLKYIGSRDSEFKKYLNLDRIDWVIKNRSNRAYSGIDFNGLQEVDFLGIGCKK